MTSFLSLIDVHRANLGEEFERIFIARGFEPAETFVQEILDELKQAKRRNPLCPKSCEGRWCSSEDF